MERGMTQEDAKVMTLDEAKKLVNEAMPGTFKESKSK